MNKKLKIILCIGLVLSCLLVFTACSEQIVVSAYDIAVKNGFVGTEEEWIASLQGMNGTNGLNGENGKNGSDISIKDLYNAAVEEGFEGDFSSFLKEYLNISGAMDSTVSVAKALTGAVSIYCNFVQSVTANPIFPPTEKAVTSTGAGVIYKLDKRSGNAIIITNFHVVFNSNSKTADKISDDIKVMLYGMEYSDYVIPAVFVGGTPEYDIAVLRVENSEILKASAATPVTVTEDTNCSAGQLAFAVGNPEAEGISVTEGVISVESETIQVDVLENKKPIAMRVMRIDAAVNPGNSGGGLFNAQGQLIGIVNAKSADTTVDAFSYAIPANIAVGVTENILANSTDASKKTVVKHLLGITTIATDVTTIYDKNEGVVRIKETIKIEEVTELSVSNGKLQVEDILLSATLRGKTLVIDRNFKLSEFLLYGVSGEELQITVRRGGENIDVNLTLSSDYVNELGWL